jgi:hypothetical protein
MSIFIFSELLVGLRKQSPPLYPKMFSFSGAVRQFSMFEKLASEAVPEIVCSAHHNSIFTSTFTLV